MDIFRHVMATGFFWETQLLESLAEKGRFGNGRSGEIRCAAKYAPLHMRENAASAIATLAKSGFVRIPSVRTPKMLRNGSNGWSGKAAAQRLIT